MAPAAARESPQRKSSMDAKSKIKADALLEEEMMDLDADNKDQSGQVETKEQPALSITKDTSVAAGTRLRSRVAGNPRPSKATPVDIPVRKTTTRARKKPAMSTNGKNDKNPVALASSGKNKSWAVESSVTPAQYNIGKWNDEEIAALEEWANHHGWPSLSKDMLKSLSEKIPTRGKYQLQYMYGVLKRKRQAGKGGIDSAIHPTSRRTTVATKRKVAPPASKRKRSKSGGTTLLPESTEEVASIGFGQEVPERSESKGESEPQPFNLILDKNQYYVEEEAYIYHNPPLPSQETLGVLPRDLPPLPKPPPLPAFPNTGKCKWNFDERTRVLLATFDIEGSNFQVHPDDEHFLLLMMERDDVTVVSEGFVDWKSMDPALWDLNEICGLLDHEFFHRFRRFDTTVNNDGTETILEVDRVYSMRMRDYGRYLEERQMAMARPRQDSQPLEDSKSKFTFQDHEGVQHDLDVRKSALYMIDMDITKYLPDLASNFYKGFRYPASLPGGKNCMMNKVTPNARPFMGPNLYVTPPASFTHFHQDGHGTVDSGHLALAGYNEIVILRRLTERHKRHALWLLTGIESERDSPSPSYFDGLYSEPHSDNLGVKPKWPTSSYSTTSYKPGQLMHINKGRLHAFRKMSQAPLPDDDCHSTMRQALRSDQGSKEQLCISIAWDWMYRGVSSEGINREVMTVLEGAILNRKRARMSLAIPELSLLKMAQVFSPSRSSMSIPQAISHLTTQSHQDVEWKRKICRGILPGLRVLVSQHLSAVTAISANGIRTDTGHGQVSTAQRANAYENPATFAVDPYGNSDFMCKLCSKELSNVYYHCDGCENLLSRDFNICQQCHAAKKYAKTIQMHPCNAKKRAVINHTGEMKCSRTSHCPCRNGPTCAFCFYCLGCSCRCHTCFTLNCRFFGHKVEQDILDRVERFVEDGQYTRNPYLDEEKYITDRLEAASKHWGQKDDLI